MREAGRGAAGLALQREDHGTDPLAGPGLRRSRQARAPSGPPRSADRSSTGSTPPRTGSGPGSGSTRRCPTSGPAEARSGSPTTPAGRCSASTPGTNRQVARLPVGDGPAGFVFDGTYVWVLNHRENSLDRIDPATNTVVRMANGISPAANSAAERIASFGGSLWVTGRGLDLLRVSPSTGAVLGQTEIGPAGVDVRSDGTNLWVVAYEQAAEVRGDPVAGGGAASCRRRLRDLAGRSDEAVVGQRRRRGGRPAVGARLRGGAPAAAACLSLGPSNRLANMARAVVLSAVRTPVGRYGGALSGERPDDLAATVIAAAVERAGVPAEAIEDVYFGAANQAGRGQPERRAHGVPARGPAAVGRGRDAEQALRVGALGCRLGLPCGRGRRRRSLRRGRSGVDVAGAARAGEAGARVPARRSDRLGHDSRLAFPEPAAGGDVPARVDG